MVWRKAATFDPARAGALDLDLHDRAQPARRPFQASRAIADGRRRPTHDMRRAWPTRRRRPTSRSLARRARSARAPRAARSCRAEQAHVLRLSFFEERPHAAIAQRAGHSARHRQVARAAGRASTCVACSTASNHDSIQHHPDDDLLLALAAGSLRGRPFAGRGQPCRACAQCRGRMQRARSRRAARCSKTWHPRRCRRRRWPGRWRVDRRTAARRAPWRGPPRALPAAARGHGVAARAARLQRDALALARARHALEPGHAGRRSARPTVPAAHRRRQEAGPCTPTASNELTQVLHGALPRRPRAVRARRLRRSRRRASTTSRWCRRAANASAWPRSKAGCCSTARSRARSARSSACRGGGGGRVNAAARRSRQRDDAACRGRRRPR